MRLLYAEDEAAMAEAVADILTFHKYTVEMVDNGQDALDFAMEGNYDGIILDIMMPNMDGLTVLRKLRAAGDHTPVLLLTAKSEVADRIEGLDLGADDYLPKPFVMEELLARVRGRPAAESFRCDAVLRRTFCTAAEQGIPADGSADEETRNFPEYGDADYQCLGI